MLPKKRLPGLIQLMRFLGTQWPSWSVTKNVPSGLTQTPFAARNPFETWIAPRRHAAAFETVWAAEQNDLAMVLRSVLGRLHRTLDDPPFTLLLHSAPFAEVESPAFHWHFEIVPHLLPTSGFDGASGFPVNPLLPEDAARFLREARG